MSYLASEPTMGTYSSTTGTWTLPLLQKNTSETLEITARCQAQGSVHVAEVSTCDVYDPDSHPNNHLSTEDDQAAVYLNASIPTLNGLGICVLLAALGGLLSRRKR